MENTLLWVIDSPYSRSIKWLLLNQQIAHSDHLMTWDSMQNDALLKQYNPKQQVPTFVTNKKAINDSLLIALRYLPQDWHSRDDAQCFRLADSDVEAAIIFLFRANLLANKFGESNESLLMHEAGLNVYKSAVDHLLDYIQVQKTPVMVGFGSVLLYSTILAALSIAALYPNSNLESGIRHYRFTELKHVFHELENDRYYQQLTAQFGSAVDVHVPFVMHSE